MNTPRSFTSLSFTSLSGTALLLGVLALGIAGCGDDSAADGGSDDGGDGGTQAEASQEVKGACDPASQALADSLTAQDCGDNYALFQAGCERRGTEAEDAGCLAEFQAEQDCLVAQVTIDTCTCAEDKSSFGCGLPCLDEAFAREQCVGE